MSRERGRVVILAYYFPPLAGIASERAFSLSHHLRDLGWDVVVVTARDGFYHRSPEAAEASVEVVKARSIEISRLVRQAYSVGRTSDGDREHGHAGGGRQGGPAGTGPGPRFPVPARRSDRVDPLRGGGGLEGAPAVAGAAGCVLDLGSLQRTPRRPADRAPYVVGLGS